MKLKVESWINWQNFAQVRLQF